MKYETAAQVIELNQGDTVDFGEPTCELVPSDERIKETERLLGQKLPSSYIWFLKQYGGGTVHGDEILMVSAQYSPDNMLDIAAKTLSDRRNGFINNQEISICFTDFGEQFLLDASKENESGEYPVIRKTGDERKIVAVDFSDFLVKLINENIF